MSSVHRFSSVIAIVAGFATACGGDTFAPTLANVSGSYAATTFTTTTGGITTNQLAAGASLSMLLAPTGTVTGRLFVPNGDESGGDLDADLAGTWSVTGTAVEFTQNADTFVRDMQFTATQDRLTGEATFGGTTVRVVLTK